MFRQIPSRARRTRALRAATLSAAVAGLAGAAVLLADARPVRAQSPLTLRTITIDGQFSDWDAVLANALQTTQDGDGSSAKLIANCGLYSTDRDCPQTGGAGNDFLKFAWTYDATNVYLYVERYGSTSNTVDLLFVADVNRDGKLDLVHDRVIHARWFGSSGTVSLDSWQYQPAAPGGDPIACVPTPPATRCLNAAGLPGAPAGYVDGYKLPGNNVNPTACTGCSGKGQTAGAGAGTRVELAIPWAAFGASPSQPFTWHVISSNNGSIAGTVDNIGGPGGRLGSFVLHGVALGPDRSGGVLSPGEVSYVHTLVNQGNDTDTFDLVATSSQGARLELYDGADLVARDLQGDGTWDYVAPGRDADGDGRPDVTLAAGAARDLTLRVSMPAGRAGEDATLLTATSALDPTATATATDRTHVGGPAFLPGRQDAYTQPTQPLPFRERLVNGQLSADTFALVADAGCAGSRVALALDQAGTPGAEVAVDETGRGAWDWVLASADTDGDGQPDLGPVPGLGGEKDFWLVVTPPAGAATGSSCTLRLEARGAAAGAVAPALHGVAVARAVTFTPDYTRPAGTAGRAATGTSIFYPAVIRNAEAEARAYALASVQLTDPAGRAGADAPRVWSDPDGDGNPADGAPITTTHVLAAFGGEQHVVVEVRTGAVPVGTVLVTSTTATATAGGAAAQELAETYVGHLGAYADALHADASGVFAPCSTVYVEAAGLLPGDVGTYQLEWLPPGGPAVPALNPWPTTARGTAAAELSLGREAALGTWMARLVQGGATAEDLPFDVELSAAIPALATDRARYHAGDAVGVSATVRNGGRAALAGTRLQYSASTGATHVRDGLSVSPGAAVTDAFTLVLPADAEPGHHALTLGWYLSCGGAPAASGTASFDVAPAAPVVLAPAAGAAVGTTQPTFQGTGRAGAAITLVLSRGGVDTAVGPIPVDGAGSWSYALAPAEALADGAWQVTAVQTAMGVASDASAPVPFAVDTVAPAAPVLTSPASGTLLATAGVAVAGTADADAAVVELYDGATLAGSAAPSGGAFGTTLTLADGEHVLTARALDAAGNRSAASAAVTLTVDTTPPAKPVLFPVATPTRLDPVPLTGTAEAGASVAVLEGGVQLTRVTAGAGGAFTVSLVLPEGAHAVVARATDAAGNTGPDSDPVAFTVDRTAPAVPLVAAPAEGALLGAAQAPGGAVPVAGAAEALAAVEVQVDGAVAGVFAADAAGAFSATVSLADGLHLLQARAVDGAGNASPFTLPRAFTLDLTPPGTPILTGPADGSATAAATVRVAGLVADADAVSVVLLEGGVEVASVAPVGVDFAFDLARSEGTYRWQVLARDAAGNASAPSAPVTVVVDRTAPAAPVVLAPAPGAALQPGAGVVFTGTAEPGATVTVAVDGGAPATAVVGSDGSWSLVVAIGDGAHAASVQATDAAGNGSAATAVSFTVDGVPPAAPAILAPAGGSATNAASVIASGTAEPGAAVHLRLGGAQVAVAVAGPSGAFSAEVPLPASDGQVVLDAVAVDAAGNASTPSAPVALRVDRTAPGAPALDPLASPTRIAPIVVTGSAEPGATVEVRVGAAAAVTATAGPDGRFLVALALPADGTYQVSARAVDLAGNAGAPSAPVTLVVDRTAPSVPVLVSPVDGATLGAAALLPGGVSFSGTAEPGASVEIELDGQLVGGVLADASGAFQVAIPVADGLHTARVRAVDEAGNASPQTAPALLVVDTAAPAAPTLQAPGLTRQASIEVTGAAEPGAAVSIRAGGVELAAGHADAGGAYAITLPLPGQDGALALQAVATDAAGNASAPCAPVTVVVDRTAPGTPVIDAPAAGATLEPGQVEIRGRAEPGATVELVLDGAAVEVTAAADGSFAHLATVAAGDHALAATARDAAGNASGAASLTFTAAAAATDASRAGTGGCGCSTGSPAAPTAVALLALLALAPRRRRGQG